MTKIAAGFTAWLRGLLTDTFARALMEVDFTGFVRGNVETQMHKLRESPYVPILVVQPIRAGEVVVVDTDAMTLQVRPNGFVRMAHQQRSMIFLIATRAFNVGGMVPFNLLVPNDHACGFESERGRTSTGLVEFVPPR